MFSPLNNSLTRSILTAFILLTCFTTPLFSQVAIWGASQSGGSDQLGTVFSILEDGSDYQIKHNFVNNPEGAAPRAPLTAGEDGMLYGITGSGGENASGTIFRYSETEGFEVLYHLDPETDGSNSRGELIEVSPGTFIGTTFSGAGNGSGAIFRFNTSTGMEVLHSFNADTDGGNPTGGLAFSAADNTVYGTCSSGGTGSSGTAFRYHLLNGFSVVHHFTGAANGAFPQGGLILAQSGLLFGTTQFGGVNTQGTIFSINPASGAHNIVYSLNGATGDGRYPFGKLVESSPGTFVGTCSEGGATGTGTVFKVTAGGTFTRLKSFQASVDGGFPKTGLAKAPSGLLYGTAEFGGQNGFGTLYTITEGGAFTKIRDMEYVADGSNPAAALMATEAGVIYGNATAGGANNFGTIFKYIQGTGIQKLHDFSLPIDGSAAVSITGNGEEFYGLTSTGGDFNSGVAFKTALDGTTEKIHDFNRSLDGQNPNARLTLASDGFYYGTARFGGENDGGTVFRLSLQGELDVVHHFGDPASGQFPYAGLVEHSNGNLYGTTIAGGDFDEGVIFSINPQGEYTVVKSLFGFFDGGSPEAGLTEAPNGKLYGVNTQGGFGNSGTLYEYDPATEAFLVMHEFNSFMDGAGPRGRLMMHSDGSLYGTTAEGASGGGTLFRYTPGSTLEVLHYFDPSVDGAFCTGGLAEDEVGKIYGFCSGGGANDAGTVFAYSDENGFELIYSFSTSQSANPSGTPALFFPECYGDSDCEASDVCNVAYCNFGICEETPINPVFTTLNIGDCQVGLEVFDYSISISLDISPGGTLQLGEETIELDPDMLNYQVTFEGIQADGAPIVLDYSFEATGCSGTTGSLGNAPAPCPPVETTFILNAGDLEVDPAGIHIGGDFQNWIPAQIPMTLNSSGLWEATVAIPAGTHEFNFFNGSTIFDGEYVVGTCAVNGKRIITIGEENETFEFCWSNCLVNCTVGLDDQAKTVNFNLYPNPIQSGGNLIIDLNAQEQNINYSIFDISGRILQNGIILNQRSEVNIGSLAPGLYSIYLYSSDNISLTGVKQFIVQ